MISDETHYVALAAAYARGVLPLGRDPSLLDDAHAVACARDAGVELHRFKRTSGLPRVRAVLGVLRGMGIARLVDLGSGRGAFVWPLLDALPEIEVTAIDLLPHRAKLFVDVARGGIERLSAMRADIRALPLADGSVPCVTALEVLEHLPDDGPVEAAREALRVATTCVIATVPSKPDNNPEHVQLFDARTLEALFLGAGARKVTIDGVLDHFVVVARK